MRPNPSDPDRTVSVAIVATQRLILAGRCSGFLDQLGDLLMNAERCRARARSPMRLLLVLVPFARPLRRSDRRVSLAVTVDD
jgi:hypothetical protein